MGNIRLFIQANKRLFINGAVLKVDRKVSIELLNDATFLLETHVLHKDDATTPLRQLYYVVQLLLMDPANASEPKKLFRKMVSNMLEHLSSPQLIEGIKQVDIEVSTGKVFSALKILRMLYPVEAELLNPSMEIPGRSTTVENRIAIDSMINKEESTCLKLGN